MDKKIYLSNLYDYYKELFTDKQKMYFEDYYFNDLSLSEIAENSSVSRNAVFNQLKIMEEKLIELENCLKLDEKKKKIINLLVNNISDELLEQVKNLL